MFAGGAKPATPGDDKTPELYEPIGRLKVELDWMKKSGPVRLTNSGRCRPGSRPRTWP